MEGDNAENPTLFPATVGEKLRAAREAQKLDLSEIASRTRIPQRHLEAIEQSNFASLPSVTYAMGFARAYARAVGADETALARELRAELGDRPERPAPPPSYDFDERSRVPSRGIALVGAIVALLVVIGGAVWFGTDWFRGSAASEEPAVVENVTTATPGNAAAPAPVPATGGQVTLVALDTVWLRVTDAGGKRLFEKEMAAGERYDVPADADRPRVRTGRPDRIQVLLNGSNIAPLGTGVQTVEAEVSAAALQARGQTGTPQPVAPATPPAAAGAAPAGNTTAIP
ncbi:cytoskeletal protein RodZ [Sphingomonas naasensis]|uniref:Helix-turn-helix domain-containing protein n=1 Tax=Sphingomonas naasensis TaxID=1344951 RepID=A0A4S1WEB3_9SPHN|nr:helix-turn-helix domain-containing protein [Sphingomonas naasensis]NIJ21706.1 cytoskeletal protein RodZ [Sphingomonas naasensis]TGX41368.1 helix-turn-helix domain-containing protein [Sphingomonas naasensis]